MNQEPIPTLFPIYIKAVWARPANLGTADASQTCGCDDSCEYVVKDKTSHPLTPHSEWFCCSLADRVGIAGPAFKQVMLPDASLVFGSRWHNGALPSKPGLPVTPWWQKIRDKEIDLASVAPALTRIYVFDHFVHNVDRHAGNFLFVAQPSGHAVLAFDYSRAWGYHGLMPPPLPFDAAQKTVFVQRQLTNLIGPYIDKIEARRFATSLQNVPKPYIKKVLDEQPAEWLDDTTREKIMQWWGSSEMLDRLEGIAKGIENGSYL